MPLKCESCKHYRPIGSRFEDAWCEHPQVKYPKTNGIPHPAIPRISVTVSAAREICNKEGDGIFVYFEPRNPGGIGVGLEMPAEQPKVMAAGA